jgi:hypothetical protein
MNFSVWCDYCEDWKSDFIVEDMAILCADCDNGLVMMTKDTEKETRKAIAKAIWGL